MDETCSFDGCDIKQLLRKLCRSHYRQFLQGKELRPLQPRIPVYERDSDGNKMCRKCKEFFPESEYTVRKSARDGLNSYCRWCQSISATCNKFRMKESRVLFTLDLQQWKCDICKTDLTLDSGDDRFNVDRDHSCCESRRCCGKCVRSFLCRHCIQGLGRFFDDPKRLRAAAEYLERWDKG